MQKGKRGVGDCVRDAVDKFTSASVYSVKSFSVVKIRGEQISEKLWMPNLSVLFAVFALGS